MARPCIECGKPVRNERQVNAAFCSAACRRLHHNRRLQRGAILYDAVMLQHQYPDKTESFEARVARMVQEWAGEDQAAGRRRTTRPLGDVQYDLPRTDIITSSVK